MTRRCFFVEKIEPEVGFVRLPAPASHHLEKVLRLRAGDPVEIRDGLGNAWTGVIERIEKGAATVRLTGKRESAAFESGLEITLALGLVRSDTMDLVVRQATELGVARLVLFRARRSQYGLAGVQARKKGERWARIAREAICQCGRTKVPEISIVADLDGFLDSLGPETGAAGGSLRIFAREGERDRSIESFRNSMPRCSHVVASVGPEGGWDDSEATRFEGAGFHPVHLGPRILRFETAAIALVSSVQLLWGDLGK